MFVLPTPAQLLEMNPADRWMVLVVVVSPRVEDLPHLGTADRPAHAAYV